MAPTETGRSIGWSPTQLTDDTNVSLRSAGLDWVTVTAKTGDRSLALLALARTLVAGEIAAGNRAGPVGGHGYVGNRAGQAGWGHRHEDVMLSLTGALAYQWGAAALQMADTAARVDLQVTAQLPTDNAQERIWSARYKPEGAIGRGKPITRQLIDDSAHGLTCYLGSPKSPQRGRVYDKHRESPTAYEVGCIRYEIQLRRGYADGWRRIAQTDGLADRDIAASVREWFKQRGVQVPLSTDTGQEIKAPPPVPTDFERLVQWLAHGVAPSLRRWETPEQRAELAAALGLTDGGNNARPSDRDLD